MSDSGTNPFDNNENFDEIPPSTPPVTMNRTPPPPPSTPAPSLDEQPEVPEQSVPENTNVIGMDLNTSLGGLTKNLVAIACQHKRDGSSSNINNNFEKELKSYTAVKLKHIHSKDLNTLNIGSDKELQGKDTPVSYHRLDSSTMRNLTEITKEGDEKSVDTKKNSQKLFSLIKQVIANNTDIDNGIVRSTKRDEIVKKNTDIMELSGMQNLKFADKLNTCTQIVFGYKKVSNTLSRVVGRIQTTSSLTAGGKVQSGDFEINLVGEEYVITTKGDTSPRLLEIMKKVLDVDGNFVVAKKEDEEKPEEAQPEEVQPEEEKEEGNNVTTGGKTRRRKRSKKGTRKHKAKRTMKKVKKNRRRSIKK